jgi:hypothetical protein
MGVLHPPDDFLLFIFFSRGQGSPLSLHDEHESMRIIMSETRQPVKVQFASEELGTKAARVHTSYHFFSGLILLLSAAFAVPFQTGFLPPSCNH